MRRKRNEESGGIGKRDENHLPRQCQTMIKQNRYRGSQCSQAKPKEATQTLLHISPLHMSSTAPHGQIPASLDGRNPILSLRMRLGGRSGEAGRQVGGRCRCRDRQRGWLFELSVWEPVPGNSSCASCLAFCDFLQVQYKSSFLLKRIGLGFLLIANTTACAAMLTDSHTAVKCFPTHCG